MAKKGGLKELLVQQCDKILVLVSAVVLLVSLGYLTQASLVRRQDEAAYQSELGRKRETKVIVPIEMAKFEAARKMIEAPAGQKIDPPVSGSAGLFAPERRVSCINPDCRYPIPWNAKKCVFCGTEQPVLKGEDPKYSTARDGVPDSWKKKYGLGVADADLASKDLDGDGFTVLQEYLAGTDPNDAKSHPDIVAHLRVKEVKERKLPFIFTAVNTMPDNRRQYVFNEGGQYPRTHWVKEDEEIGKTGFKAGKFTEKFEERVVHAARMKVDLSTVEVVRTVDGRKATLQIKDMQPASIDQEAVLVLAVDPNWVQAVFAGMVFEVRGEKYKVEQITRENQVVISRVSDGKRTTVIGQ